MSSEEQSIGMMEGAFFVPKSDLIGWVNSTLSLEITKIEQLGTGAAYCNLIDAMFPGKVAMQRVNWKARNEWEFINNYKILQQAFAKCKIQKYIDIEKLSKCRYQDNLEFIQWLKRYFDLHNKNDLTTYDAPSSRKEAEIDFSFVQIRNPLRNKEKQGKDSSKNIRKSKSPYDNVKAKINNRSLTVGKHRQNQFFIDKLSKIKEILKNGKKESQKISKIQQLIEEIEEDLPTVEEADQANKIEKSQSKNLLGQPKRDRKPKINLKT